MALTTVTPKIKRSATTSALPAANSVMTKTFTIDVPTGGAGSGYYTGDTIRVRNVFPKGTELTGFWWKTSATQGATLTLAPGIYTGGTDAALGTLNTAAFVSAVNLTSTSLIRPTLVPGTGSVNTITLLSDGDLGIVLAGTTVGTTAATITITVQLTVVDTEAAAYTTYTV